MTWLGFASGAALAGLALLGLALHEIRTERVVHSIEVRESSPEREFASAGGRTPTARRPSPASGRVPTR